ncbi:hypothetical protein WL22_05120 [Burkholderia ubonensis]|nr:hypothetical protein WL22_05120 [Burkholderia ubonensis]
MSKGKSLLRYAETQCGPQLALPRSFHPRLFCSSIAWRYAGAHRRDERLDHQAGSRRLGRCDVGLELHIDLFNVVVRVRLSVVDRSVVPRASRRL